MREPPNEGPDDWYFDEQTQRWLRYSGRARWRQILDERRRLAATPESQAARREFLSRIGLAEDDSGRLRPAAEGPS